MNGHYDSSSPYRKLIATAFVLVGFMSMAGCSRQQSSEPLAQAPPAPLAASATAGSNGKADDVLVSETTAGGIPATYRAFFTNEQLERIVETRGPGAAQPAARTGEYHFHGARLTKYAGAVPGGSATLDLEFDLRGAVTTAHSDSGNVPQDAISAIRTRAQLLRSHALAQRAARAHRSKAGG